MGVSVSAAVAIIFTGFMISASIFFAVFDSVTSKILDSSVRNYDDVIDRVHTDISITNATYNWTSLALKIDVKNTGSITLDARLVQLMVDGKLLTETINWTLSDIDGTASHIWAPDSLLTLIVSQLYYPFGEHPDSVVIITQNCISDLTTEIYIPP